MKKKYSKKIVIIVFLAVCLIALATLIVPKSYSRYNSSVDFKASDVTGALICNAKKVNNGITEDGIAFFEIEISNYENNIVSSVPITYNVNIKNKENSTVIGKYKWIDEDNNTNNKYETEVTTIDNYLEPNVKKSSIIRIEVKTNSNSSEKVDYEINLNCEQAINK